MIKRLPWLRRLKKTDPEVPLRLPIACGPVSNGEGWWPDSPRKRLIRKLVMEKADQVARREGIDRREFMASACGMATTLYMINMVNGCSSGGGKTPDNRLGMGGGSGGSGGGGGGGGSGGGMSGGGTGGGMSSSGGMGGGGTGGGGRNGGSGGSGGSGGGGMGGGGTGSGGDGPFTVPDAAMEDPDIAQCILGNGGNELVIDMQSHFGNEETNPFGVQGLASFVGQINPDRYPWLVRTDLNCPIDSCITRQEFIDQILNGSDTSIAVLSGISYSVGADGTGVNGFAVLSNEDLLAGVEYLEGMFPGRMLSHCMVMPNDRIDVQLAMMEANASTYTNWKTYPPWGSSTAAGYWLDGKDDPDMLGPRMIQKGIDLGSPIFCIHKGFPLNGFSPTYTDPRDVGPAANMFPDAYLVIYHSAFEHGVGVGETTMSQDPTMDYGWGVGVGMWPEGPYDEENPSDLYPLNRGVNSLVKSLRDNNIGPNGTRLDGSSGLTRVYAECGGVWPNLITGRPEEAMHYWGKLLKHVGEDRLVWGTDCLWFGSPQPLIEAFRNFQITEEFQEMYGYPEMTPAIKEKILGQNAARLQSIRSGVDISGCHSDYVGQAAVRQRREHEEEFGRRRDMKREVWGPRTRREFLALRAQENAEKVRLSGNIPPRKGSISG